MTTIEQIRARARELSGKGEKRERVDRILTLLEHYQDVLEGITDGERSFSGPGDGLALMCEAWNAPAYRQLEVRRAELARRFPEAYVQLREVYFVAGRKRVAMCPRCGREFLAQPADTWDGIDGEAWYGTCKHGGDNVRLRPTIVRVVAGRVDVTLVVFAVLWLEANWQGGVFVPEDVLAIEGRRAPRRTKVLA